MSRPTPSLKQGILSNSFRVQTSLPAKELETGGIDADRTIITPLEARKLQSAESLKPLSERDIGPGSFVALTQRAAARNVKAGLVDAFTRNRSVVKPAVGTEVEAETGAETEIEDTNKTKPASTGEVAKPKGPLTTSDASASASASATSAATPNTKPTSNSPLPSPSAKKTIESPKASPTSLKPWPLPSHHNTPPNPKSNTDARVSSAGSISGKRIVSNTSANGKAIRAASGEGPLQESNGDQRAVSIGADRSGGGKTGGQDGEVNGIGIGKGGGKADAKEKEKEKRKSDGKFEGTGNLKKG